MFILCCRSNPTYARLEAVGRGHGRANSSPRAERTDRALRRRETLLSTVSAITASLVLSVDDRTVGLACASETASLRPSSPTELLRTLNEAPRDHHTVIVLAPGEWRLNETLNVRTPITLRGAGDEEGGGTTIILDTDDHYVPAITITSSNTTIESLSIRHRSPSVANNYAVYLRNASDTTLSNLDISSSTGTGVAIEGGHGTLEIVSCLVHNNKNNGIGLFPGVLMEDDVEERLEVRVSSTGVLDNGKEAVIGRGLDERVSVAIDQKGGLIRGGIDFRNCDDAHVEFF